MRRLFGALMRCLAAKLRAAFRPFRALQFYCGTKLTWRTAWHQAGEMPRFQVVSKGDGYLYIEPRPLR
jgi:hypothetical protein